MVDGGYTQYADQKFLDSLAVNNVAMGDERLKTAKTEKAALVFHHRTLHHRIYVSPKRTEETIAYAQEELESNLLALRKKTFYIAAIGRRRNGIQRCYWGIMHKVYPFLFRTLSRARITSRTK